MADNEVHICGRTLIIGDGTVLSPGFVTLSPKTGLIKAVSSGTPTDHSMFFVSSEVEWQNLATWL